MIRSLTTGPDGRNFFPGKGHSPFSYMPKIRRGYPGNKEKLSIKISACEQCPALIRLSSAKGVKSKNGFGIKYNTRQNPAVFP